MSAGAVFKLIANDGKADRMIMATKLLNQRIKDVMCARRAQGKADTMPTLVDLERTHIIFVNAHFKPFAAIGYEYNKVRTQAGQSTLGSSITFSIPQFGDFFYDMVCRVRLSSFSSSVQTVPLRTTGAGVVYPNNGTNPVTGLADPTYGYQLVDAFGNVISGFSDGGGTATYQNLVRYCEYPGNRLFQYVKFDVNNNPLDEYDDTISMMLQKFTVPPVKEDGYNRLVGQEVFLRGYTGPVRSLIQDYDSANTPTAAINAVVPILVDPHDPLNGQRADTNRTLLSVLNGPQTPKLVQPTLDIWNKLRFWFNDDVRLAIPSVSIPFGQRFITMDLAPQNLLTFEFPNLYLQTVHDDGTHAARTVTYTPIYQQGTISEVVLDKVDLYVNNIFVNPEVHDIFIKRIGFSLIRVYRKHRQRVNKEGSDEQLLSQLKWPIEYIYFALRPAWNTKSQNPQQWRDWHRCTYMISGVQDKVQVDASTGALAAGSSIASSSVVTTHQIVPNLYEIPIPTVDQLSITAHGISIFDSFDAMFFNAYMPFNYGGPAIRTPNDIGALFINFALFPKSYQPSGHFNISRAREFYVRWNTNYISSTTSADLLAIAIAINFLLITDGSAVLRYST